MTSSLSFPTPVPSDADPRVVVRCFGTTDVGHTREHNEDTFLVADLETGRPVRFDHGTETVAEGAHGLLFLVADGMGGAAAGEVASAMAAQEVFGALHAGWREHPDLTGDAFAAQLRDAVLSANAQIHARARAQSELRGMGTTATVVGLLRDELFLAQVGDSRAYLLRDGRFTQLTKDQSLMQRLVEAGEITAEEAEKSDRRNIILQAAAEKHRPDLIVPEIEAIRTEVLASIVREEDDPAVLAHRLVARANELGGPDNITVIVAAFEGAGLSGSQDGDAIGHAAYPLPDTMGADVRPPKERPPTPIKSDPTPAHGVRVMEEEPRYRGPTRPVPADPDEVEERRRRARPVMILLLLLAIVAAAAFVVQLLTGGD